MDREESKTIIEYYAAYPSELAALKQAMSSEALRYLEAMENHVQHTDMVLEIVTKRDEEQYR